ncbi:hypothetical protein [Thermoactinospora rubra]|uniref:hypothetical protein n=1 Tax=Thermoactinospora rubra TaxID=1088767 RepID=UPI000A10102E|nr:hypothetical protein [Thermoactinospora rubra]
MTDPDRTIRHRWPTPGQAVTPQPPIPDPPRTQRLPYTPDMFPDVPQVEAKPPRSAWWWVVLVGGLLLLVAAISIGIVLWATRA